MVYKDQCMLVRGVFSEGMHFIDMMLLPRRSDLARPAIAGLNCAFVVATSDRKTNKKGKTKKEKKPKHREASKQIYALETIEGVEEANVDSRLASQVKLEKKFGQSPIFVASTLLENGGLPNEANTSSLLKEAIHVIRCGYEDKTKWGNEVGWIYGSVTEDILTGFKMHCYGWRFMYCMPKLPAFKGSAPINLSDRLHQVLRWALGLVEIFLSKHCPIWYCYGGGLKWLE
ncbi:hypothetical protein RND71_044231 [Anisodus tanguticus]|uniref:Cellulose synthase n=1 Tax=Anisodus tanguticus TaxID=243964 RepID=A0AAE1QR31_9SOLA|nr:hypothetical protein RND71_044231 [Anisodus tanguticus]